MKKKILIGSLLVLTLLLLMPSIPAIQQKTIDEGIKQDLQEKLDSISLDDLKDIEVLDRIRHPILYAIVTFLFTFSYNNFEIIRDIAVTVIETDGGLWYKIHYPLLFILTIILMIQYIIRYEFWMRLSNKLNWNWNFHWGPSLTFNI